MPLAQINIARMIAPIDSEVMKEFKDFIVPINELAKGSPGFIWRFKDDSSDDTSLLETPWSDDPLMIVNMSVWSSLEELRTFTYTTVHSYFVRSRKKWFHQLDHPHTVLWWVPEGHEPTLEEARGKLDILERNGATAAAFTFAQAALYQR